MNNTVATAAATQNLTQSLPFSGGGETSEQRAWRTMDGYSLKNYRKFAANSQETDCFSSTILHDGIEVGCAANEGHGGSNNYDFKTPSDQNRWSAAALLLFPRTHDGQTPSSGDQDLLFEEVHARFDLIKQAEKTAKKGFPFTIFIRRGATNYSLDYTSWNEELFLSINDESKIPVELYKAKAEEWVCYNCSTGQLSVSDRYRIPDADRARIAAEEVKRKEAEVKKKQFGPAESIADAPRFTISRNDNWEAIVADTETGKSVEIHGNEVRTVATVLGALFGK